MTVLVATLGCALAAAAALLPLRRAVAAGGVVVGGVLWAGAALTGGIDAARPLAAACVFLLVFVARRERAAWAASVEAAHAAAATDERARIARELHDGLTHLLTGQLLTLETARAALDDGDADALRKRLADAARLSRRALTEATDVVQVLGGNPPDLALLRTTAADWSAASGTPVVLDLPENLPALNGSAWSALLATLREALTNTARHGAHGAYTEVAVSVTETPGAVRLLIKDSGASSAHRRRQPSLPPGAGTGLQGLRERAALTGGEVIAGPVGTGWQVQLTIPTQAPQ